jgi:oxygen-independent coproporphyrinogen-3 oxidase
MAGLYIHIPFCASRCIYCGFYSTTLMELRDRYVDALCHEMALRQEALVQQGLPLPSLDTIYIGGGTPSQLSPRHLKILFDHINKVFSNNATEVTIEMNPDDVTEEYAHALSQLSVNRVSMGAQTFDDTRLRFLNRRHNARQVPQAVKTLREAGISNISIDLMYGFPGETIDNWQDDITKALDLGVEHLSAYCLMIEEGTVLYEKMRNGENERMRECDEELERQMYYTLTERLKAAGYEHYEISNFALPGRRSRHNSSYWTDLPYIGLGAAAHSYDGRSRCWNVADIRQYINGIENGSPVIDQEWLNDDSRYNDRVMLSLRTCEGIDLSTLQPADRTYLLSLAQKYIDNRLLTAEGDHLRLSNEGLFVSDMIMSDLMKV